jgi:uncharacterized protein YcbX
MHLSGIYVYPVKSCAGLELAATDLDRFGPVGDRRWMVVGEGGDFITQRVEPRLALIRADPSGDGLQLQWGESRVRVDVPAAERPLRPVRIWSDTVGARDAGDAAAAWLSDRLGRSCRLVYMPDDAVRRVDGAYAGAGETVGFADGFPLLLISDASLADLNGRLPTPVPMNRFRPNLVVAGCEPFAEDGWKRVRIGAMTFVVAKPCSRCVIPSIVQESAQRDRHINRVLASYRRVNGQILFGQNLLYQQPGQLAVGDEVEVLE